MKELLLVPCSGSKQEGGQKSTKGRKITKKLPSTYRKKLCGLRDQVAKAFKYTIPSGNTTSRRLKKAHERYTGHMYKKIQEWHQLRSSSDLDLVIVSALYGLIYWDEPIINYDVAMDANIAPHRNLNTWWRKHGLGTILAQFITHQEFDIVRSFLSQDYQQAVGTLDQKVDALWIRYEYSGLGSGSNYYRGEDITRLLRWGAPHCPNCHSHLTKRLSKNKYECSKCGSRFKSP